MTAFFVQLDPRLQELIVLGLTALVTYLLVALSNVPALKWLADYLGQYKAGIVTWLAGLVFNLLQNVLNRVPESWDTVLSLAMQLIVEVVLVLLSLYGLRKRFRFLA